MRTRSAVFLAAALWGQAVFLARAEVVSDGSLVIVGGGQIGPEIAERFVALGGGPTAQVVLISTAGGNEIDAKRAGESFAKSMGLKHVTVLHTLDRAEADSEEFVAPLKSARGVWFGGGRHWRLVDFRARATVEAIRRAIAQAHRP